MSKPSLSHAAGGSSQDVRLRPSRSRRRRHPSRSSGAWRIGWTAVAVVVAVVVVIVAVGMTSDSTPRSSAEGRLGETPLAASVETAMTHVPRATLDAVGTPAGLAGPVRVSGRRAALKSHGKPEIVYIGAEWCPYCATERWPLVIALSRFGTFTGLRATHSSTSDVYPGTATVSFYGSHLTSPYVRFSSVELNTNQIVGGSYGLLQRPTRLEAQLLHAFDRLPYSSRPGSIPFIDFGNRYVQTGASYSPQLLQGLTQAQIADQLRNPENPIARGADGTANLMTAAICQLTGNQPLRVCSDPVITRPATEHAATGS